MISEIEIYVEFIILKFKPYTFEFPKVLKVQIHIFKF